MVLPPGHQHGWYPGRGRAGHLQAHAAAQQPLLAPSQAPQAVPPAFPKLAAQRTQRNDASWAHKFNLQGTWVGHEGSGRQREQHAVQKCSGLGFMLVPMCPAHTSFPPCCPEVLWRTPAAHQPSHSRNPMAQWQLLLLWLGCEP